MNFWTDKRLWVYEIGLLLMFTVVAGLAFIRTGDFHNSLFFLVKVFLFMQPILLLMHFVDRRYRKR